MNKPRHLIAAALLLATSAAEACWYPTFEPQYYLAYNLDDGSVNRPSKETMTGMWHALLPGASIDEIKSVIYSDGYSVDAINALDLPPTLKKLLGKNTELREYIVVMRQTETECNKTSDPWYFYYDSDPKLQRLDSLATVSLSRLDGIYGDRYAIQAARALRALKKYDEIIAIAGSHSFSDQRLQSLFEENLASAYYYTGNYEKALEIYRETDDETSLRWTLEKLGKEYDQLALARQLSFASGNEASIISLLQSHIRQLELANDRESGWFWTDMSLPQIGEVISTSKDAADNGLECYRPAWQYTEGFAYLMVGPDYAKADSVFAQIDITKATPHLKDQVRTMRFITQSALRPYDEAYKDWLAGEASWLCAKGSDIIDIRRKERAKSSDAGYNDEWYCSLGDNVIFCRNTHQSDCYPLDMLHRAADCIVVPKMLEANDTVSALQLLDLVDHAGLTPAEIKRADDHGCASVCFAMEAGADNVIASRSSLDKNSRWSDLIRPNGSIVSFPDRWNDLIGTLLLAEARYDEAIGFFSQVSDRYMARYDAPDFSTDRNPFALEFFSDPWCHQPVTWLPDIQPRYKEWFARRMSSLHSTMTDENTSDTERAKAAIEYATGMANSVHPCWALTQFGRGSSLFFPYKLPDETDGRRGTEIIHDFICDDYFQVDTPTPFDRSRKRFRHLKKESERIIRECITSLDIDTAAGIYLRMGRYMTIKHHYADTDIARQLRRSCDRWSDW